MAGSAGVVIAVAVSRLYLNAHWLSDVIGGFCVGLAYLLVIVSILEALGGRVSVAIEPAVAALGPVVEIAAPRPAEPAIG